MLKTTIGDNLVVSKDDEPGIVVQTILAGQVTNTIRLQDQELDRLVKFRQDLDSLVYSDPDLEAIQEAAKRPSSVGAPVPFQEAEAH